jgi:hypothetical protein
LVALGFEEEAEDEASDEEDEENEAEAEAETGAMIRRASCARLTIGDTSDLANDMVGSGRSSRVD